MHESRSSGGSGVSRWVAIALLSVFLSVMLCAAARATSKFGPLEVSGNLETQNLIRHPDTNQFQFVQNRNTARLRLDWDWVQNGKLIERIPVPFIERSKLYLLYRGVYDGFYDIAPGGNQMGQTRFDDIVGGAIAGDETGIHSRPPRISGSQRGNLKYENDLREGYIDAKLKDLPVSLRIGRQQVIWGESDQFRIMDIWNPLDVTWHFQQESWDNIRIPLWLAKGIWDIGDVGRLSNVFLEVVYNPFDFQPGAKVAFLPQPWSLPFPDPLRAGQVQLDPRLGLLLSPRFDLGGTSLSRGNFQRNPEDASEVGVRAHFVTPQGVELSANYLYGRGRGVGAASPFAVNIKKVSFPYSSTHHPGTADFIGSFSDGSTTQNVVPVDVQAEVMHPYMHIVGVTGNYFEGDFTNAVLRFESAYAIGEPYQTVEPDKLVPVTFSDGISAGATSPLGYTTRDIWTGMIGFDRPTWIRWANSKATWFLTAQFFWNYTSGDVADLRGNSGAGEDPYFTPPQGYIGSSTQGLGVWKSSKKPAIAVNQVERIQDASFIGNADAIRRWEHLITFAGTSFYRSGTVVPFWAFAWDPVNDNLEALWNIDYYYSNDVIISLQQKYFTTYGSQAPSSDPWFAGGRFSRRDETGIKLTYQF